MKKMTKEINYQKEDRDQQILRRLANIEHKVDSLDQTTAFALRAEAERHFETVKQIFKKSKRRVQVYLSANGERSVQDISNLLTMRQPNVSNELRILQEEGLLEILEIESGKTFYCKKPIDKTIRISTLLQREYDLDENGLPITTSKE
jgi:DNA-binding transcriptional ArsR family regulator